MITHGQPTLIDHSVSALALADGDIALASLLTGLGIADIGELVSCGREGFRLNKCEAEACGVLADNAAKDFAVFAGVFIYANEQDHVPVGATLTKLVTGTATIGTKTGIAGGLADDTHLFADTLATVTETAFYADLKGAYGSDSIGTHSPADNTVAKLIIPETGLADFLAFESVTGLKWRVRMGA